LKKTSRIEVLNSRRRTIICLREFFSSHSLARQLGTAILTSPFSMEIMLVDLNQVAKIAGETFNCIWARIARQIFSLFAFCVSIVQDDQLSDSLIITRELILPGSPQIPHRGIFFCNFFRLDQVLPENF